MQIITLLDLNDFVVSVRLDGAPFRLRFSWNERAGLWSLTVMNDTNQPIVAGIRCVPNYPLLSQYRRPTLPKGELLCITQDDQQAGIARADFVNGRVKLVYVTEVELRGTV